jgi:hypothetical protein
MSTPLTTLDDVKARAGISRYDEASEAARRGQSEGALGNDLAGDIWYGESPLSDVERVDLTFAVFNDLPGYGVAMYVGDAYPTLADVAKARVWEHSARLLDDPAEWRADSVLYWLEMDIFGGGDERERDAWQALTATNASDLRLRRLLPVAGQVSFALKLPLLTRLEADESWHQPIAESLRGDALSREGRDARRDATTLISRLKLGHPHAGFDH